MNHKAKSRNESSHSRQTAAATGIQSKKRQVHSACRLKGWYGSREGERRDIPIRKPGLIHLNQPACLPLWRGTVLGPEIGSGVSLDSPDDKTKFSLVTGIG